MTVPSDLRGEISNITQRYRARFKLDSVVKGTRCRYRESILKPRLVDIKNQKDNEDIQNLRILPKQRNLASLHSPSDEQFSSV